MNTYQYILLSLITAQAGLLCAVAGAFLRLRRARRELDEERDRWVERIAELTARRLDETPLRRRGLIAHACDLWDCEAVDVSEAMVKAAKRDLVAQALSGELAMRRKIIDRDPELPPLPPASLLATPEEAA